MPRGLGAPASALVRRPGRERSWRLSVDNGRFSRRALKSFGDHALGDRGEMLVEHLEHLAVLRLEDLAHEALGGTQRDGRVALAAVAIGLEIVALSEGEKERAGPPVDGEAKLAARLGSQRIDAGANALAGVVGGDSFAGCRRAGEERLDRSELLEEACLVVHAATIVDHRW